MKIITFDAHLIEDDDLVYVQDNVMEHQPCVAFFKITYPLGNRGYFMATADNGNYMAVSIGRIAYEAVLRINT